MANHFQQSHSVVVNVPSSHCNTRGFDYQPRTRLIFGENSIERAGELAGELGARRVLVVTDPGIVAAGHAQRLQRIIEKAGLQVSVFDRVRENPTTRCVDDCAATGRASEIDFIIGLGGGSAMDTAKGCNFILTNGGRMHDYWGMGKASKPMLPSIAIPTTAGTGSECQSVALISDEETHQKMACGDPKAAARVAILDPTLTISQPGRVAACTGIDAVAHAIESAVTKRRTPLSQLFSRESFRLLFPTFERALQQPDDANARGRMLLGAAFAGVAIENSMLGAAHSAANPLTAHFGIVHGQAVGMMLPHVMRFNAGDAAVLEIYAELADIAGLGASRGLPQKAFEALIERLECLLRIAGMPTSLRECGVAASAIPAMAEEAAKQWTAGFNPRAIDATNFRMLYEAAF